MSRCTGVCKHGFGVLSRVTTGVRFFAKGDGREELGGRERATRAENEVRRERQSFLSPEEPEHRSGARLNGEYLRDRVQACGFRVGCMSPQAPDLDTVFVVSTVLDVGACLHLGANHCSA